MPVAAPLSARGLWLNAYYQSDEEIVVALADALKEEYKAIVDAGFILQIDDAFLAHEYERRRGQMSEGKVHKFAERCIDLTNYALTGIPEDKVRYHVCWGSWNAPHTYDVPLRTLADLILKVKAQAYSLEAANPRHEHEWMVWKDIKLPDGKILIPGMVTHSTNVVEHPDSWRGASRILPAWSVARMLSQAPIAALRRATTSCAAIRRCSGQSSRRWPRARALRRRSCGGASKAGTGRDLVSTACPSPA